MVHRAGEITCPRLQLREEADVLDGDDSLVGESLQELNLTIWASQIVSPSGWPDSASAFRPMVTTVGRSAVLPRHGGPAPPIQPSVAEATVLLSRPRPLEVVPGHDEQLEALVVEASGCRETLNCQAICREDQ